MGWYEQVYSLGINQIKIATWHSFLKFNYVLGILFNINSNY